MRRPHIGHILLRDARVEQTHLCDLERVLPRHALSGRRRLAEDCCNVRHERRVTRLRTMLGSQSVQCCG